jgi:ATP-dependent Zn protease
MSKSSSQRQQSQRNDVFSLLPYAYHEAGHAVVGHVIGRLIALVSIKQATSYRGCCRFDAYAESTHRYDQWQKGRQNPELLTILYAGTVAVSLLCEQRGWDYEVLRSSSLQDEAEIEQLSGEMFADDAQRTLALDACRRQAADLLTAHWDAVKALAGELLALQWLTGAEAHAIMG